MRNRKKQKRMKHIIARKFLLLFLCVPAVTGSLYAFAESANPYDARKLQNGSFEEDQTFTNTYSQMDQSNVPAWNTTAFQGKIELFKKNDGTYIKNVTLEPTAGDIAAELNADEESTLYQNVKTTPSSVYEWGLDHGARNGTDTMALVIGPKQSVDPSKPSKAGRDQLMQMVDWLIDQGMTSVKTSAGLGEQLTVYSKKFAASGTFEDNAGNDAFSLTPSTIYTEEWHIWIMASNRATSGKNPWNSYGSNADGSAESGNVSGSTTVDLSKYYLYTVPKGQTDTLFGFVSVGYVDSIATADKAKTYGNFLDNINFHLYHPLSGSTTTHGSAVVGGSDGTTGGTGSNTGHQVTVNDKLATYVTDGEPLKVQAVIKKADLDDGCEFIGVYYTVQDENGNPQKEFLQLAGNEIEDTGSLTDEEKKDKWIKSTDTNGDVIYTYYLNNITSATDLHFVFIKSPTLTYDPNGGKPYIVERTYNTEEAENVYSFKPAIDVPDTEAGISSTFISPYVSHAAEGQNDGWKFMGWLLTGDTVTIPDDMTIETTNADKLGSLMLPAVHTVACNYSIQGAIGQKAAQYFKVFNGNVSMTKDISKTDNGEVEGMLWADKGEEITYANIHKGLTMVAQWRWRQAFIPQVNSRDTYIDSANGGTVKITSVTDTSDENYNDAYNANGGKSYHANTDETITVEAIANEGYTFEGWYDEKGNLVTTNAILSYTEIKESVATYYARFSGSVTQTYIRQIKNGDTWDDTTDDKIGTLDRYTYTDAVGTPISSTANAGTGYKFVGWYDANGNKVADDMLFNKGITIGYTTTGNATYYARFETAYTVIYDGNGSDGGNTATSTHFFDKESNLTPNGFTRTGYEFISWNTKADGSGTSYADKESIINLTTVKGGSITLYAQWEKDDPTKKIIVTKKIKADDINFSNGNPSFIFKVAGDDVYGNKHTYYGSVTFTKEYVDQNAAGGYVSMECTFDTLYAGAYTVSEEIVSRYRLQGITDVVNGTVTSNGQAAIIDFTKNNGDTGSVLFTNDKYEWQGFTDTDTVINHFDQ